MIRAGRQHLFEHGTGHEEGPGRVDLRGCPQVGEWIPVCEALPDRLFQNCRATFTDWLTVGPAYSCFNQTSQRPASPSVTADTVWYPEK
jgi:hypothetical protein